MAVIVRQRCGGVPFTLALLCIHGFCIHGIERDAAIVPPRRRGNAAKHDRISAFCNRLAPGAGAPGSRGVGRPGEGIVLKPGMFFTVEPMINLGRPHVKVLSDGWTAVTRDRSLSAQFEHSVGVTDTGVEVFTLSPKGYTRPPYGT